MLEMTTFNKRLNRWVVARPETMAEQQQAVMVANALGWTLSEIAADWNVSQTRIQQIKRQGERRQKDLASTLQEIAS